jgi:serine/threonine-protein kinase
MAQNELVGGRYRVEKKLGQGGMGVTLLAVDQVLERRVVIKRPLGSDMGVWYTKEAKAQAALNHANAVKVYDFGVENGQPYLVMEWVAGWDLHRLITSAGRLHPDRATDIIRSVGRAVAHAHALGVIHRDIKPQNILIGSDEVPRLADFGLAKLPAQPMTAAGQGMGTPGFAAPEQWHNARGVDGRADIYALGMTLLAMLSGRPVPENRTVVADVPPEFHAALYRCLELKPKDRHPTVEAFLDALPLPARQLGQRQTAANMVGTEKALKVMKSQSAKPARKADHVELLFNLGDVRFSGKGEMRTIVGYCTIPAQATAGYVVRLHETNSFDIKRATKALAEYSPAVGTDDAVIASLVAQ